MKKLSHKKVKEKKKFEWIKSERKKIYQKQLKMNERCREV